MPKSVVRQFRTVVSEIGANREFIISRAAFQAGAREAAKFTNIDLLSWTEFEGIMFDRWLEAATLRLNPLFKRAHALDDPNDADLWKGYQCNEEARKELHHLSTHYQLTTSWALLLWLSPGSLHEIVHLAVTDEAAAATSRAGYLPEGRR